MPIVQPIPVNTPIRAARLTATEKLLVQRFMDETGFVNPLAGLIQQVITRATTAATTLLAAAALPDATNGYEPLTSAQLTALATNYTNIASSCNTFLTHSNRLTGVTFDDTLDPPDLSGLLAVASGYNAAKESMRDPSVTPEPVDNFSPIFNSLVSGEAERTLNSLDEQLKNFRNLARGNRVGNYQAESSSSATHVTSLSTLISQDNSNYTTAKAYLRKYGTAVSLNAAFSNDEWAYFYARNNIGDGFTREYVDTIRSEKAIAENLPASGYTGSASDLRAS